MKLETLKKICENIIGNDGSVFVRFDTKETICIDCEGQAYIEHLLKEKESVYLTSEEAYAYMFHAQDHITDIY